MSHARTQRRLELWRYVNSSPNFAVSMPEQAALEAMDLARRAVFQSTGTTVRVLRLPDDGAQPDLWEVKTTEMFAEVNGTHVPNGTYHWGPDVDITTCSSERFEIWGQADRSFNGVWYFLKTADSSFRENAYFQGGRGDVILVKVHPLEYDEHNRVLYGNVPLKWEENEALRDILLVHHPDRNKQI